MSDGESAKLERIIEEAITYSLFDHGSNRCPRAIIALTVQIYRSYQWQLRDSSRMLAK